MTFIAAFHLDAYCLVAADSRAVYYQPSSTNDAYKKISDTPSGLIAGSGLLLVTEFVQDTLTQNPARLRASDISEVMLARTAVVSATLPDDLPKGSARTGFVLTTVRNRRLVLELYHSDNAFAAKNVNIGFPLTLLPIDIAFQDVEATILRYKAKLRPIRKLGAFDDSLLYHLEIALDVMREARALSEYVGPSMQVGYYRVDGEHEVLEELLEL